MIQNQAVWERAIRIVAGIGLMAAGYMSGDMYGHLPLILILAGAVLVLTGAIAYCPVWHLLGFSSKSAKRAKSE